MRYDEPMAEGDDSSIPLEHKLIHDAALLDVVVIESDVQPTVGDEDWVVRLQLQVDEEIIDSCAHGLIFAIGVLSFHDARPRGVSGEWFEDGDQFTVADLLSHITFENGKLHMYVDYLRGRCVKTTIDIASDGKVRVETVNRGKAALAWIARLQGKKLLQPVSS
ncbi:MAG: hypothetical protein ABIQ16_14720 [Polyangiaceae bacterium]